MISVVVTGVTGRMGNTITRLIRGDIELTLVGGTERSGSPALNTDGGGFKIVESLEQAAAGADVVIDFTSPEGSVEHARICAARGVALVIGSTGFTAEAKAKLSESAKRIPIVMAPNMSVGVNLMIQVAGHLAKMLGPEFDVEVVEAHHRMKKDAPSGTALRLAEEIAEATGRTQKDFRTSREGVIGERPRNEIGIQTLRGGDVVGEHTVHFYGDGERVELTHRATSRDQFARGALRAAKWISGKPPGLYDMRDVLGFARHDGGF